MPGMDENEIVAAVCEHLINEGHQILERRHTTERGIDNYRNAAFRHR